MAVPVLSGLVSVDALRGRDSIRRESFTIFPAGSFPLAGFLSLTEEEETNSGKFTWFEDRHPDFRTELEDISTTVPFCATTSPYGVLSADFDLDVDDSLGINVADRQYIILGDVLNVKLYDNTTAGIVEVKLRVTILPSGAGNEGKVIGRVHGFSGTLDVDHDYDYGGAADETELVVRIDTNAREEGSDQTNESGWFREPVEHYGYVQTNINVFDLTEEAKVSVQDYDGEGAYDELFWQHNLKHMETLEKMIIDGHRHIRTVTDSNGISRQEKMSGGILWTLKEWEKADSTYRGGTGAPAITADTDDNKRIIENAAGTMSYKTFLGYVERLSRKTNNKNNAKLCVCGGIAFSVLNEIFDGKTQFEESSIAGELDKFGATWKGVTTPFLDIHFVVHPLFRSDPERKYWLMFVDMDHVKWMYLKNGDTKLIQNIQNPGEEVQRDKIRTMAGVKVMFPESHMLIKNVRTAA